MWGGPIIGTIVFGGSANRISTEFRVSGVRLRVWGLGCGVWGLPSRAWCSGLRFWGVGLGFRVLGYGRCGVLGYAAKGFRVCPILEGPGVHLDENLLKSGGSLAGSLLVYSGKLSSEP